MSNQIFTLDGYRFSENEALLFDANIWLYIYGPRRNISEGLKNTYTLALRRSRGAKSQIFLDLLVLSEFINAYSRLFYNNLPQATKPADFKTFRNSDNFRPVAERIGEYSRRILAKTQRTNIAFESMEMESVIDSYVAANVDFNDLILAELCKANDLKLVTHDADFKGDDLTILTVNPKLLGGS